MQHQGCLQLKARRNWIPLPPHLWLLAPGQLISWGTLYYGITFLAGAIEKTTGWSGNAVFGAYSAGLLVTAIASPLAGRMLTRLGGRLVMSGGSLLAGLSCVVLAESHSLTTFVLGWMLAGIAMTLTLYEAAFSALREFEKESFRKAITTLSLVGGFASTIFWPLTHFLVNQTGWRRAFLVFAALHVVISMPLHLLLPRHTAIPPCSDEQESRSGRKILFQSPIFWFLALAFFAGSLFSGAISAHAGRLLVGQGVDERTMLIAVSLFGPMQVFGRILDLTLASGQSLRRSGYIAFASLPVAIGLLLLVHVQVHFALAFACVYGMANGVLTIVGGLAPAELLHDVPYGAAIGWLSAPAMLARALAPEIAVAALSYWGNLVTLIAIAGVGVVGFLSFALATSISPDLQDQRR